MAAISSRRRSPVQSQAVPLVDIISRHRLGREECGCGWGGPRGESGAPSSSGSSGGSSPFSLSSQPTPICRVRPTESGDERMDVSETDEPMRVGEAAGRGDGRTMIGGCAGQVRATFRGDEKGEDIASKKER